MPRKPLHTLSLLLCVAALGTVTVITFRQPSSKPPRNEAPGSDLQAAVDRFRAAPAHILTVQEPISLLESDIYADGGSRYIRFRDAKGVEFLAMRLSDNSHPPERCRNFLFGPAIPHPMEDLPELPPGSDKEQALCGILTRWADNDPRFARLLTADRDAFSSGYGHFDLHDVSSDRIDVADENWRERYFQNRALVFTYSLLHHAVQH